MNCNGHSMTRGFHKVSPPWVICYLNMKEAARQNWETLTHSYYSAGKCYYFRVDNVNQIWHFIKSSSELKHTDFLPFEMW